MKIFSILPAIALLAAMTCSSVQAQNTIVTDDFEGVDFSTDWDSIVNATILTTGGADGTANFATVAASNSGPTLGALAGVPDVTVDFFVQIQDGDVRQFNFQFGVVEDVINSNNAALNLRFEDGAWDAFDAGWQEIPGLTALTPGAWHRVRISGVDWGTADARYDIEVSAAGETAFNSSATGLTFFQGGDPTMDLIASFNFNARFGNNPGFNVDQVTATTLSELPTDFVLGDVNCDGAVDFLDISPFITLLSDGEFLDKADINEDQAVDFLDISPFITLLAG